MAVLNIFMFTIGIRLLTKPFLRTGPSEILLNESAMEKAKRIGYNVFQAVNKPVDERKYLGG